MGKKRSKSKAAVVVAASKSDEPPPSIDLDLDLDSPSATKKRKLSQEEQEEQPPPPTGVAVDKGKLKKRRKEFEKALVNPPSFSFDTRGFKGGRTIQLKDVRDLVLHLLANDKSQPWLYVENRSNLRKVVCLMIPGITCNTLGLTQPKLSTNLPFPLTATDSDTESSSLKNELPIFSKLFSHACPTKAPGEKNRLHSGYQTFLNCPLTSGEKDRREKQRKLSRATGADNKLEPNNLLLTLDQMKEQNYPLPTNNDTTTHNGGGGGVITFEDWKKEDGWIEAPIIQPQPNDEKILGLDCEMCLTEDGSELARLSLVDQSSGQTVFDRLVKPRKPILDYLTRFSGLTPQLLKDVTTSLEDVQRELTSLIDRDTILLGHSLESDLKVLKLRHGKVIDTSIIYQHPRGPPFKASLKWLAQKWLKREIQTLDHDSIQDAKTCVDLLNLKLEKGSGFGEFSNDQETIFERLSRGQDPKSSALIDHGHGNGNTSYGQKAKTSITSCQNDDQVLQNLLDQVEKHDLTIARFMDLSHTLGWSQKSTVSSSTCQEEITQTYSNLNQQLTKLHNSLPPLTALIIFTGHSDPRAMVQLQAKKLRFDQLWKTVKQSEISLEDRWMESDDRKLLDEVERCRFGLSFYCVKN